MNFIVVAYDGTDEGAPQRRAEARESHLALGDKMRAEGELLFAVAITNDDGDMIGSVMVLDMHSRKELDEWMDVEPYVTGDVWKDITVHTGKVAPSFLHESDPNWV